MTETASLLIEIGTEELPPKILPELAKCFARGIVDGLLKRGIEVSFAAPGDPGALEDCTYYTPRRLAVRFYSVALKQPAQSSEVLGPYLNIGLDAEGRPTPALIGFAAKNALNIEQLEKITDAKGERFVARHIKAGAQTAALLPQIVTEALKELPIVRPMRWGNHDFSFVRPAHWLVMLLGNEVVAGEVLGLQADRMSRGHRFHAPKAVWLSKPEDYVDALRAAYVLVDPRERVAKLRSEINAVATQVGGIASVSESLLAEVNCLVEWPSAVLCSFEPEFLRVPHEALISTMQSNQKFFPILDAEQRLSDHFIGIANIESSDPAQVRKGYERVIRPRFADAQFFYEADLQQGLESMRAGLGSVTYQQKLGSYADKSARVAKLAATIAQQIGLDTQQADRAAELSKADLQSRMVGEFPELQGIMGRYYTSAIGETSAVADAIDQAYMPRFAGDAIAPTKLGQVLAIAERLDTLAGGFAAGLKPSGNKDPFALRRNALGLARTLIEGQHELPLKPLLLWALRGVAHGISQVATGQQWDSAKIAEHAGVQVNPVQTGEITEVPNLGDTAEIHDFIYERLRGYYADQGYTSAQFEAVVAGVAAANTSLLDFDRRLKAIAEFAKLPDADALVAANKRIRNILKKSEGEIPASVNSALLTESAERELDEAINAAIHDSDPLLNARDYLGVLKRLATLRIRVDSFFDSVMVMADDAAVQRNRLALLKRLADRFAAVAAVELLST